MATKRGIYNSLAYFDNAKDPATFCPKDCKYRDKLDSGFYCNFIGTTNIPRTEFNDGGKGCELYTVGKHKKVKIDFGKNQRRPKRKLAESDMEIMQLYIDGKISQKKAYTALKMARRTFVRLHKELTEENDD